MNVKAFLEYKNGQPVVNINGELFPPMALTARTLKPDYLKRVRDAGIRVFFVFANTDWMRPGTETEKSGFETFCDEIGRLLSVVPDAYVIVRLGMHPPVEWVESHPDDMVRYDNGETMACELISEIHKDSFSGCYSLCSKNWQKDGTEAMLHFCEQVENSSFADRVIGYFLAAGNTSEWYYANPVFIRGNPEAGIPHRMAGYCPSFQQYFEGYLREHYEDEAALQKAWNDPTATFENPKIPSGEAREFLDYDGVIQAQMQNLEQVDENSGDLNTDSQENIGVFLNAVKNRAVYDFYEAWHFGTADSIIAFAKALKAHDPDRLTGAFYGSLGCTDFFGLSTSTGTERIITSGVVDFLAAPGVYNNREPGGSTGQREMHDSFRLHGASFVVEDDARTHLENDFYRDSMRLYTPEDSCRVLKREFGRNLCQGTYAWWFDQHLEGGRYDDPQVLSVIKQQQRIATEALSKPHPNSEIAIIGDLKSVHLASVYTNAYLLDLYRTSELSRIGAGADYYHLSDLSHPDMPDYKCYLMLNAFRLSDADRKAITEKAARNRAVIIWLYGAGIYDPEQNTMNEANVQKTVGMKVRMNNRITSPRFDIVSNHGAVCFADKTKKYGFLDRSIHSNVWLGEALHPAFVQPGFYIEEDESITVLGRYSLNGLAAFAVKDCGSYTSLYCATASLRSELLRSAAAYAGCHIYSTDDDTLYANGKYVTIHASYTGEHTLRFKEACRPYEVYEDKYYGESVKELKLHLDLGETKMFRLD